MNRSMPGLPVHQLTPGVHPNPCPQSWWCHPTISSSVVPFSSCPQSFPASGSFQVSQLFTSGGQSIEVSASTSVLPMNTQDWSPLGWTGWISLQSKGLSRVFSNITVLKHQFFGAQLSSQSNSHIHTCMLLYYDIGGCWLFHPEEISPRTTWIVISHFLWAWKTKTAKISSMDKWQANWTKFNERLCS